MKKSCTYCMLLGIAVAIGQEFDGRCCQAEARHCPSGFIAYEVPDGTVGNQEDAIGALGHDFDVREAITVTHLGVFDSAQDGLQRTLTAVLYNRNTQAPVASLTFTPQDPGELFGGSRFKELNPSLHLPAGFMGTMVADGYGPGEPNGNGFDGPVLWSMLLGAISIDFVGTSRYGPHGSWPTIIDMGPANRYAAGTFEFSIDRKSLLNGDTNGDGTRDLSDAIYLLSWLFSGGPAPVPLGQEPKRFLICNGDGTVTDPRSALMWRQEVAPGTYTWQEASDYCSNLNFAGHDDWRLPQVWELLGILAAAPGLLTIDPVFEQVWGWYWSSETDPCNPGVALAISSGASNVGLTPKLSKFSILAVRSTQ